MPELVIIVFRMRLPDEDEPIALSGLLHTVAEIFPKLSRLGGNFKMSQQRLEFRPTGWTLRRRVGHAKCFVVHMGRRAQPFPDRLVRAFVQLSQEALRLQSRHIRLMHVSSSMTRCADACYKPGRFSAVTGIMSNWSARRTLSCNTCPASTWQNRLASRFVMASNSGAPLQAMTQSPTLSPAFSAGIPLLNSLTT